RSAEALGVDGVLLSPGCADLWSPKVVRASMGAVFRLKVYELQDFCGTLRALRAQGMKTLAATADAGADDLTREPLSGGIVACVGNEGAGLSAGCLSVCDKRVTIRMKGRAESLNAAAAAAILMWEIEKQR
ncbi:MAG: RNA methyltransferase, partial [Clostridia bacterium]|nr:RNA methyltransferase [Clostridia bacterium]